MLNVSSKMRMLAQRIADKNGVSADEVIRRFMSSVEKKYVTREDFFIPYSDISLSSKKVSRLGSAERLAARPVVVSRNVSR